MIDKKDIIAMLVGLAGIGFVLFVGIFVASPVRRNTDPSLLHPVHIWVSLGVLLVIVLFCTIVLSQNHSWDPENKK